MYLFARKFEGAFNNRETRTANQEISVQSRSFYNRRRCALIIIISMICSVALLLAALIIPVKENRTHNQHGTSQGANMTPGSTRKTTSRAADSAKTSKLGSTVSTWSEWTTWEPHNISCGHGTQRRKRGCNGRQSIMPCIGPSFENQYYNLTACQDCYEWYHLGKKHVNGIYSIQPDQNNSFLVYCDMTVDGGGWTVFQRRKDGSEQFWRTWDEYKTGFGNLSGEFWLGNDYIHRLTIKPSGLRVDLQDWDFNTRYAKYETFAVGNTTTKYTLQISSFKGTTGDSLSHAHNGIPFSTKDQDNDLLQSFNCAEYYRGGWWYNQCHESNLNGIYLGNTRDPKAVTWLYKGSFVALKFTEMKLRRN